MSQKLWTAYTDGASRGNPGPAAAGIFVLAPDGKEYEYKKFLGDQTNNFAEYQAMILALKALAKTSAKEVLIKADSQLMVRQMQGQYKVKNENIIPLYKEACELLKHFQKVEFEHIPRNENKKADALANLALDEQKL